MVMKSATMMKNTVILVLVLGLMLALPNFTDSATTRAAPAPAVDCSSLVLNMADCLSFVTNGSTEQKPEGTCCSGLKSVLKTDAQCVCEAFKNSAQLGVTLNITKALTLPSACHVSAPSVSSCGMSVGTGAAPAISPMALPPSSTAAAPTSTGGLGNEVFAPAPTPVPGSGSGSGTSSSSALAFTAFSPLMVMVGIMFLSLV